MSQPDPTPPALIVLRLQRAQKGRYVAASRAAGLTLMQWIAATLDAAAPPISAIPPPKPNV